MEFKTIEQSVMFKARPHEVYEMLMDSRKHTQFTGAPAEISREVGGKFTAFGGGLSGKTLELVQNRKIVQSWRAESWPDGHYSTAVFLIEDAADGTKLSFVQAGVPQESYDNISEGWHDHYWKPMKKTLEN